ncbi:hypothetical protein EGM51_16085 [Verrucomicrobia bacterium S94]|nr:hypothetical protein EGM51_16085 [Verrucomicrobia bacterium S94]
MKSLILCMVCVLISVLMIRIDAGMVAETSGFGENSATERMQLVYLFFSAVIFARTAVHVEEWRSLSILMAGGTLVMMIREMDGALDHLYHGAWFPFAVLTGSITLTLAWRWRGQLQRNLEVFLYTPAFGALLAAGLSIFVFSRLFGMKDLWESVFGVEQLATVQRWVKNAVEEGSELFGYTLLFLSAYGFNRFSTRFIDLTLCCRHEQPAEAAGAERVHAS